jgi:hypothetical protein
MSPLENIKSYLAINAALENQGRGICSFVLSHGREWTPAPFQERNPIKRGTPKQCFANSQAILVKLLRKGIEEDYTYVEGYATSGDLTIKLPVLHAWLVDLEGRVIDATWNKPEDSVYFGVPFRSDYIFDLLEKTSQYHSLIDHFPSRWELLRDPAKAQKVIINWEQDVVLSSGPTGLR